MWSHLHKNFFKPKPSFSSRLRLSEKKKKRRQEKYAKRLKSPKEITQFLDGSGSESSSEDGRVSPAQQKGEPVKPRRQARGNRICDDSSDISTDENGAEKSKGSRTQSRNKACDSSSDESTTENRKLDKDEIGRNQRKRELFPIGGQNKEIETESGKKTPPSEERDRQRTVQTSPAPSHQRRQSGDNRIISPGVVNGKRRQRFESSEEAHAEMVARSPRAACCSDINTVSGKIQRRRRSSAINTDQPPPALNGTATSLESVDSADDPGAGPSGVKRPKKFTIRITRKKDKPPGLKFRQPYTLEEEKKLLGHFQMHGGYSRRMGRAVWTEMEKKNIIPGRSWQSMKCHFIKILQDEDKLDMFGCTVEQLKDSDREVYRVDEVEEEGER